MSAMSHDVWRRDEPTAEDEEIATLGERDPADEPREPVDVDLVATLTVGDHAVELSDEERDLVGSLYDLLGCLTDRANASSGPVELEVQFPEGSPPLGNNLRLLVQPGSHWYAWTHGDPTRGYRH